MVKIIAGVDEAGRGAWAGPLIAAAVIMPGRKIQGVRDSKQLTALQRERLYEKIIQTAQAWSITSVSVEVIDQLGVHQANLFALSYVITHLPVTPDHVLIDGFTIPHFYPTQGIVHGDALHYSIAAASILAKVTRDHMMQQLDHYDNRFGFAQHKGYGTKQHQLALQQHGVTAWHRHSFTPIQNALYYSHAN